MEWRHRHGLERHGIVLSSRPHGETGLVDVAADARRTAAMPASSPGGISRKSRPTWQSGNVVEVAWRAKHAEQLGNYTGELREAHAARALDDAAELAGLSAACALIDAALPEREPHPAIFDGFRALLGALGHPGLAGDLRPAGAGPAAGAGLRPRSREVRGHRRDRGSGLRLAQDRPGGVARRGRALQGKLLALPAFLIHRRPAGRSTRNCAKASI